MKKKALTKKNYIAIAIITAAIGGWFWYSNNKEEIKEKTIEKITDLINNK